VPVKIRIEKETGEYRRTIVRKVNLTLLVIIALVMGSGCYYYGPPTYGTPPPSPYASYDYVWDSAMRAAQDVGIQITSANKNTGAAFGQRDGVSVTIQVMQQSDGRTRVELTTKGSQSATSAVADDFYRAYDHYMGRR
jgi:hypothetical protein